ncbi:MAG TPA: hypothetical protein VN794_11450 [Methylomirabilota bacterium]|nr:hypothetical protein [Methylomirabilota bacterium]
MFGRDFSLALFHSLERGNQQRLGPGEFFLREQDASESAAGAEISPIVRDLFFADGQAWAERGLGEAIGVPQDAAEIVERCGDVGAIVAEDFLRMRATSRRTGSVCAAIQTAPMPPSPNL